jgi:hypothetical protein
VAAEGRGAASVWGMTAVVALYIGAAGAIHHGGKTLPPWLTAATPPSAVAHGGKVSWGPHPAPNRCR